MLRQLHKTLTFAAIFAALPLAFLAQAAEPQEKYFAIVPPQPTSSGSRVEVIEIFSYGCVHCAMFQPQVDAYLKRYDPQKVQFSYLPATFRPDFALLARGFYAARQLGMANATHQGVFEAIFTGNMPFRTFDEVAAIYERLGVSRADFMKAAASSSVEENVRRADMLMRAYQIDGTPTIIVAGKYRVTGDSAGGNDKVFAVVDELIAKELKSKKQ